MARKPSLKFRRIHKDAVTPVYKTAGAAGMDVAAVFDDGFTQAYIQPGATGVICTGLEVEIPDGYEIQVRSRSGLAANHGVCVLNAPGTIDSDYRGEIKVILHNTSGRTFMINTGDRIAQLVLAKVERLEIEEADQLSATERGAGGLGSTGV